MKTIITMISRVTIFLLLAGALYGQPQDDRLTPFILDNLTLVAENGEQIVFQEHYRDVIKKDLEIVREYDAKIIIVMQRMLEYDTFRILFGLDFRVRDIVIEEPGPKLLNGIQIGEPLENFLKDFQENPRYRVDIYRKTTPDEEGHFFIYFEEFEPIDLERIPMILVMYDEDGRVTYINAGYDRF